MAYTDNKTGSTGRKGGTGPLGKLKGGFQREDQVKTGGGKATKPAKPKGK
jgi:hypothetical protein